MAKASGPKVSVHSRAARRAASPSINLDKSITSIKTNTDSVDYNPKASGAHDAGISKKKQKPMTRTQRRRKEKALERGDQTLDILEQKTAKSMARAKRTDDRRAKWEELNTKVIRGVQPKSAKASKAVDEEEEDMSEGEAPKSFLSGAMPGDEEDQPEQQDADISEAPADTDVVEDIDEIL